MKVTTATGCGWSAASNATWIAIYSGANGTGSDSVGYSVSALPAGKTQRTGTMTVAGRTVTVVQSR